MYGDEAQPKRTVWSNISMIKRDDYGRHGVIRSGVRHALYLDFSARPVKQAAASLFIICRSAQYVDGTCASVELRDVMFEIEQLFLFFELAVRGHEDEGSRLRYEY